MPQSGKPNAGVVSPLEGWIQSEGLRIEGIFDFSIHHGAENSCARIYSTF